MSNILVFTLIIVYSNNTIILSSDNNWLVVENAIKSFISNQFSKHLSDLNNLKDDNKHNYLNTRSFKSLYLDDFINKENYPYVS